MVTPPNFICHEYGQNRPARANPCVEHGLTPIGRPPVLPRAGLNPRYGIAAQPDSVGHQNNTLATTTGHPTSLYGNYPSGKIPGIGNPTTTLFVMNMVKLRPARATPGVEHGLAPLGRLPVLPRAGLNPRYGIAAQTDSIGHQNNTLATTTSHLASLYGNYPFGENTRDW